MNYIANQFSLINCLILCIGIAAQYVVFRILYDEDKMEFIVIDYKLSIFEKEFIKKFCWYWGWAAVQQLIVLLIVSYLPVDSWSKYGIAVALFSCGYHFPNWRLMGFTAGFGAVFYMFWFIFGFDSFIFLTALHAFGGTAYYKLGWEMRVWGMNK
jgi:hypothetical protein